MDETEAILEALRAVWRDWSGARRTFRNEPEMQCEMRQALLRRLQRSGSTLDVALEYRVPGIPKGRNTMARACYDVAVVAGKGQHERPVALIELSYGDTNVAHALHNGELKLLGYCNGRHKRTGGSYAEMKGLGPQTLDQVRHELSAIPIRGLFFVVDPKQTQDMLELRQPPVWNVGNDYFVSALWPAERADQGITLKDAFERLCNAGLWCWYYATTGSKARLEIAP